MEIQKLANGKVKILHSSGRVEYLDPNLNIFAHPNNDNDIILTTEPNPRNNHKNYILPFNEVVVPNVADRAALIDELAVNFFFRVATADDKVVYKGEFLYNQDITLYDGTDFAIKYEGSTNQFKAVNKVGTWFDLFVRVTKNTRVRSLCSDVSEDAGEHYFSTDGSSNTNYALNNWYASHLFFRISKESEVGKEIYWGEAMRAGRVINCIIYKAN